MTHQELYHKICIRDADIYRVRVSAVWDVIILLSKMYLWMMKCMGGGEIWWMGGCRCDETRLPSHPVGM